MLMLSAYIPEMILTRRELHRYPEIAWTEFMTTQTVVQRVRDLGFKTVLGKKLFDETHAFDRQEKVIKGAIERAKAQGMDEGLLEEMDEFTGCMAVWETGRPGPVTALRFDMDCVNVQELATDEHVPAHEGFASKNDGLMHACGHDAHTAIGLAVAHWVKDNADKLTGTIKLVFQPAEEGTKGACGIAYSGNLDDVDYFLAGHIGVNAKLHEVAVIREGFMATTKMNVTYTGKASHAGGSPELGRNALLAGCTASLQLMGIARHGQGETCVNVGTLHAGEGRNVVPAKATLQLEVRGENHEINQYMQETAERIIRGAAECYGCQYKIDIVGAATNIKADTELSDIVFESAQSLESVKNVFNLSPKAGSEDCSFMMRRVQEHGGQAAFFLFGCNHNGHHQCDFDIQDTESMPEGLGVFVGVLKRLHEAK